MLRKCEAQQLGSDEHIQAKNTVPSVNKNLECTFSVLKEKQYSLEKPKRPVLLR